MRGEQYITNLVGDPSVVLENVVVRDALRKSNLLGDGKNVNQVLVRELVKLLGMVCGESK